MKSLNNPFRPGAGQIPPFLAGRDDEKNDFIHLLAQNPVTRNLVLTGLRGVGKTVLLENLRPLALENGWFWAGTDFSETASVSEKNFSIRVLADLSALTSSFVVGQQEYVPIGFKARIEKKEIRLEYDLLIAIYEETPGLASDKLKRVLEVVWNTVKDRVRGIVLAYDEAQNLKDKAADKEFPLSLLLEVIQYLQRKNIPYMLVLTGLPTLFPNLVDARTYAERMFHVITLDKLSPAESKEAIVKPIESEKSPVSFTRRGIDEIILYSGGYPYFIQFFCKEMFDMYLQQLALGIEHKDISIYLFGIIAKLDTDFYAGRWSKVTDRQRDLLVVIASLPASNEEFTLQEIAAKAVELNEVSFKPSYINQILTKLIDAGLIYKNRHGKYSFAVPLLADYINRQPAGKSRLPEKN